MGVPRAMPRPVEQAPSSKNPCEFRHESRPAAMGPVGARVPLWRPHPVNGIQPYGFNSPSNTPAHCQTARQDEQLVHADLGGGFAVAQYRKGHYRAATYVRPTVVSRRARKPSTWAIVAAVIVAIALWNTVFGSDSDKPGTTPQQISPTSQVSQTP